MVPPKWKRLAVALFLLWIGVTYLVISPLRCSGVYEDLQERLELQGRLARVTAQLDSLRELHSKLLGHVKTADQGSLNADALVSLFGDAGASQPERYEALRRRVYTNTKELWYYADHELNKLLKDNPSLTPLRVVIDEISERKRSLLWDQQQLALSDGHAGWREREAAATAALVQRRLAVLQHPKNCLGARKVVCNLNKGCGFGCQVHHIVYCLIFAYATERTLVLNSRGWRYNARGWEYAFRPLSDNCTDYGEDKPQPWPVSAEAKVVSLPFIDSLTQKPRFLPLAVPEDLAPRVSRFNGDPASWWVGQMMRYVLRPQPQLQRTIDLTIATMPYKKPIVGVHVRRTDKVGTEAAFHHLDEYVARVHDYYDTMVPPPTTRRVYLATDDPQLLSQAQSRHPRLKWVGDTRIARSAGTQRRYAPESLANLLVDLTLLSRADYLVCTFSSQVGRVAYELMQGNRADASESVFSLDDIYYFGGQNAHDRRAVLPHTKPRPGEIAFQEGDLIGVAGNHWNGFGRGTNRRTNLNGLIPWYKTEDQLVTYPFPLYPHADPPDAEREEEKPQH